MPKEQIAGLTIDFEPVAPQETVDPIHAGLIAYNRHALGNERYEQLRWIVRDAEGQIAGGLLGDLYFNWLYISILSVSYTHLDVYKRQGWIVLCATHGPDNAGAVSMARL